MWEDIKQQLLQKIVDEFKNENNWTLLRNHIAENDVEEYIITPLLKKFNSFIKKYVIIFVGVHVLIILLIIFNIFLSLYRK